MKADPQAKLTFYTVMTAMAIVIVAFLVAVLVFRGADKPGEVIAAVMGTITGVLGTLAGYVAGSAGKQKAEESAASAKDQVVKAERRLTAVVDRSQQGILEDAKKKFPEWFVDAPEGDRHDEAHR